jgi:hypothetical protein
LPEDFPLLSCIFVQLFVSRQLKILDPTGLMTPE